MSGGLRKVGKWTLFVLGWTWVALMVAGRFLESTGDGITMLCTVAFPLLAMWYVSWNPWREPEEPEAAEGEEEAEEGEGGEGGYDRGA